MEKEPILFSLASFSEIILDAFRIAGVKRVLEIGSQYGMSTEKLCAYTESVGGQLITIDPAPQPAARKFIEGHRGKPYFDFVESTSLDVLPTIRDVDAYIIDGDHNYYTVLNELEAIYRQRGDAPWLVFEHDVCWPCGRRDMYYAPERIPAEHRHPYTTTGGVTLGDPGIVPGGFADKVSLAIALQEGGAKNGVRPAIDDFLAKHPDLCFSVIPVIFGLGVIYSRNAPWSEQLRAFLQPFANSPLLERLEKNRIELSLRMLRQFHNESQESQRPPKFLPGKYPLEVFSVQTRQEFEALWSQRFARTMRDQESLIPAGNEPFKLAGVCAVCGRETTFATDFSFASADPQGRMIPAWRERQVCQCELNCRQRSSFHILAHSLGFDINSKVLVTEHDSTVPGYLKRAFPRAIGSEDLGRFTLPDASLDCIFSLDKLQLAPDCTQVLSEFARCLKFGGQLLLTVPFHFDLEKTRCRASSNPDGSLTHLSHPKGAICFNDFGWDLLDRLRHAGFPGAALHVFSAPHYGYVGLQYVIIATREMPVPNGKTRKPGQPQTMNPPLSCKTKSLDRNPIAVDLPGSSRMSSDSRSMNETKQNSTSDSVGSLENRIESMNYQSHIGQDAWVAECFMFKRNGFFLDFGAFDGKTISNTYALEKALGWKGICVEPNPTYYPSLCEVRNCVTVNAALWPKSRELLRFCDAHGLSSLEEFQDFDSNSNRRKQATQAVIGVDTLNPTELLQRFKAPSLIDYLTLDVEGAEFDVLSALDLNSYSIALMTIEHNHDTLRQEKIRAYLSRFGYEVVQNRNDDFFFHRKHLARLLPENGLRIDPVSVFQRVFDSYAIDGQGAKSPLVNLVGPVPEVLPGRHKLDVFRVPSRDAYTALWSARLQGLIREQDARFLPNGSGAEPFTLRGLCVVCGGEQDITSDFIFARPDAHGRMQPAWRERQVCTCGLNCRQRSSFHMLTHAFGLNRNSAVYCTEQTTELFRSIRDAFPNAVGSEYLGESIPLGASNQKGIRNEDITRLTFADATFDCIFSLDVMEHVPDYKAGFREMARCLKPGGRLLLTAPFDYFLEKTPQKTITRASVNSDGTLTHHLPPFYHGDPLNSQGILCFHDFGWDILDDLRAAGFPDATIFVFSAPQYGYIGQQYMIFATRFDPAQKEIMQPFRLQDSGVYGEPGKPKPHEAASQFGTSKELRLQAALFCQEGKWDKAEPLFRKLTSIEPHKLDGWKGRLECARKQNHHVLERLLLEEILERHPEWAAELEEIAPVVANCDLSHVEGRTVGIL